MMYKILLYIFCLFCFYVIEISANISYIPNIINKYKNDSESMKIVEQKEMSLQLFINDYLKSYEGNAAYLIYKDRKIIAQGLHFPISKKAYTNPISRANYQNEKILDFNSALPIASATKQMTAAGILKLQENGRLNIKDSISKYLPKDSKYWNGNMPDWANKITLYHLLTQSSGLAEYQRSLFLDLNDEEEDIKKRIIKFITDKKLTHNPGEKFAYSNSNYVLLGILIEEVLGMHLSDFFANEFFVTLGMDNTYMANLQESRDFVAGKLKNKYPKRYYMLPGANVKRDFKPLSVKRMFPPLGDGGVISTMHDMGIWFSALHEGRVISKESLDIMHNKNFKSSYQKYKMPADYGMAMHVQDFGKERIYSHGADALFMRAEYSYLEKSKITIISVSNFGLQIPRNTKYNEEELHNQSKIDIKHFHSSILEFISKLENT